MPLQNCKTCSQLFEQAGAGALCNPCVRQEKQAYEQYYWPINKTLSRLDYARLSQRTGFSAMALKMVLAHRLGQEAAKGAPVPPLEQRKGYCSLCNNRYVNMECPEPLCLPCLQKIYEVVQAMFFEDPGDETAMASIEPTPSRYQCPGCGRLMPVSDTACIRCYDAAMRPVKTAKTPGLSSGFCRPGQEQTLGQPGALRPEVFFKAGDPAFLSILSQKDEEVPCNLDIGFHWLMTGMESPETHDFKGRRVVRRFGFKKR